MRAPVIVEPAVRVKRAVLVRIVASVHEGILVLNDIALFVNPAGQHDTVLIERVGLAVYLLAEALALRAETFAVLAEVVPAALAVGAVRIALAVNEDPGVLHHTAVLIDIVLVAAEAEDAVLQDEPGIAEIEPIFLRLLEGVDYRLILPVQILPLVSDFGPAFDGVGCDGRKEASSSCRQQKRSGCFDMLCVFHVPPLSLCSAG